MDMLSIIAIVLAIISLFVSQNVNSKLAKKEDIKITDFDFKPLSFEINGKTDNVALRSVNALAGKLGYSFGQYNSLNQTEVYGQGEVEQIAEECNQNFQMLLNHLGLEIFEGKELRKKKKNV